MKKALFLAFLVCLPLLVSASPNGVYEFSENEIPIAYDDINTNDLSQSTGSVGAVSFSLFGDGSVESSDGGVLYTSGGTNYFTSTNYGTVEFFIYIDSYPTVGSYNLFEITDKLIIYLDYNGTSFDLKYHITTISGTYDTVAQHNFSWGADQWHDVYIKLNNTNSNRIQTYVDGVRNMTGTYSGITYASSQNLFFNGIPGVNVYIDKLIFSEDAVGEDYNGSYGTPTVTPSNTNTPTNTYTPTRTFTPTHTPPWVLTPSVTGTVPTNTPSLTVTITETPSPISTQPPPPTPDSTEDSGAVGASWFETSIRNLFVPDPESVEKWKLLPTVVGGKFPFNDINGIKNEVIDPVLAEYEDTTWGSTCFALNFPKPVFAQGQSVIEFDYDEYNFCVEEYMGGYFGWVRYILTAIMFFFFLHWLINDARHIFNRWT